MASTRGNGEQPAPSELSVGVRRRRLLKSGAIVAALTGFSTLSGVETDGAHAATDITNPPTAYIPIEEKGVASGVATLDVDSKIPSAQLPNLSATFPTKGGKTKTDGQNITNLRRPVLTVDSMFPNARMDHQIVWADEAIGRAYSIGADKGLRLQTWNPASGSVDVGAFNTGPRAFATATQTWAFHGLFFRTASGALLMEQVDARVNTLQRSAPASDGMAWSTVMTMPDDVMPLGPGSISQDAVTGHLYFAEYASGTIQTHIDILRSTDDGVTWTAWKSMPKHNSATNTIRHWHGSRYDSISKRVYFTAGDQNDIAGLYRVNAAGTDIEPVILNKQITAKFGLVAPARAIDIMFFETHIAWGCDGSGGQNHIYRMARDQLGVADPVVEQVAAIDNTSWWAQKVRNDGSMWVCSSSSEIGGGDGSEDNGVSHLYAVSNNGGTVDEIAAVSMEGTYGAGSLSCLSNPGSGGDVFWMRAHAYQEYPFRTSSAFQFRARVGYGAVPLIKPRNIRPVVQVPESRNWEGALSASQIKKFAHTRTPGQVRTLIILNMGVKVITGAPNSVKLQVWNATTGNLIHELSGAHQNWRMSYSASQEYAYKYPLGAYDQVEFQLVETGGASVSSVSAFIEFGFGF
jgi:hypothetical protein